MQWRVLRNKSGLQNSDFIIWKYFIKCPGGFFKSVGVAQIICVDELNCGARDELITPSWKYCDTFPVSLSIFMSIAELSVPIPVIPSFCIWRRYLLDPQSRDRLSTVSASFCPPNETSQWPKTFADIGHSLMDQLLKDAGHGAVGSKV
jgi:hypothetical protein